MPLLFDLEKDIRYQQGVKKGIEKGFEKGKKEVAINMIKKGFDLNVIHDILAISFEELNQLATKMVRINNSTPPPQLSH